MTGETFVTLSALLTFGVPLALAVVELRRIGPVTRRGDDPPPPRAIPPAPKPLPDCLMPRPAVRQAPSRVHARVLEDA